MRVRAHICVQASSVSKRTVHTWEAPSASGAAALLTAAAAAAAGAHAAAAAGVPAAAGAGAHAAVSAGVKRWREGEDVCSHADLVPLCLLLLSVCLLPNAHMGLSYDFEQCQGCLSVRRCLGMFPRLLPVEARSPSVTHPSFLKVVCSVPPSIN